MSVNKLPPAAVKLICSAQVITSVSSVVKELMENSLDAGANNIEIKLENHGLKKIEVVDNGNGVNQEDVWNMCKKSYTSKINNFEDLSKLDTYGFRGEALHSLCAVSKVSVTTKTESDTVAMLYEFDTNGNVVGSKMSHVNRGTVVSIENLFDNLPVRRQFLSNGKRKMDEIKKVEMTVKMLAVIHPRLRVVLSHNKFCIWQKNSVPNVRLSLIQAIAPTVVKQLVDIRDTCGEVTLQLLIPEKGCNIWSICHKMPSEAVFLFINHRPVRDRNIEKIIQNEIFNYFGHEIPHGKHPTCLVSIVLPPEGLDVNLEPNKTRVILKDMDKIGTILKNKLVEYYIGPLGPPKDFLDSIDTEIMNSAEKRKSDDDILEIKVKIPKIKQEKLTIPEGSTNILKNAEKDPFSPSTSGVNNEPLSVKSTPQKHDISLLHNPDKEKVVAEFMNGLNNVNSLEDISGKGIEINTSSDSTKYFNISSETDCAAAPFPSAVDPSSNKETPTNVMSKSNEVDLNNITLSQWSRGCVKIEGASIQSSTTILRKGDTSLKNDESFSIVNIDCLSKTELSPELEETQVSERSVSSQMGCKDMAGFTKYASEISKKITDEGTNGMSFTKVASELANNWRKLQESEKEVYNEKAKAKPKQLKEKDNKANASMRDQLQKFLAKCNEKKLLKKRDYPVFLSSEVTICSVRKALERRLAKEKESGLRFVGDLSDDVKIAVSDADILAFSERRLAESLLFWNNLATLIVPYKVLEKSIPINQEMLGESLWSVLVSLETALDVSTSCVVISDCRITSNGLRIKLTKDHNGSCFFEMTDVPLHVAFFCIDDLKEILTLIDESSVDLPLEECRPLKIISYIRAETIRHITINNFNPQGGIPMEKFEFWMTTIKPKFERCPHQNSVFKHIDIPR